MKNIKIIKICDLESNSHFKRALFCFFERILFCYSESFFYRYFENLLPCHSKTPLSCHSERALASEESFATNKDATLTLNMTRRRGKFAQYDKGENMTRNKGILLNIAMERDLI